MSEEHLRRVTITRDNHGWSVLRERDTTGETFRAKDLSEAFVIVRAAYNRDGSPREMDRHDRYRERQRAAGSCLWGCGAEAMDQRTLCFDCARRNTVANRANYRRKKRAP